MLRRFCGDVFVIFIFLRGRFFYFWFFYRDVLVVVVIVGGGYGGVGVVFR